MDAGVSLNSWIIRMAKTRRVKFEFDERSLVSLDRLKEQGAVAMPDASVCSIAIVDSVSNSALLKWLREKHTEAKSAQRARELMAETCLTGTNADWKEAAKNHGGPMTTKAERIEEAAKHRRIAGKYQRDIDMLEMITSALFG